MWRDRRREERFDEEIRYLLDEEERRKPPAPVVEHDREEAPAEPDPVRAEAGARG